MRITNNMLINNMINNIGRNLVRMSRYQDQLATGKKITVPSDDPVVAARALKLRTDVAEVEQYKRNVKDAQSWLDITEDALANIGDVVHRARELAVQASNQTNTPDDLKKIAEEIKQLRTQLLHLGNTTYAGRHIFSGYNTDKKLLDENTGNYLLNVSNLENIIFEIGIGDSVHINIAGGDLFNRGAGAYAANGILTGSSLDLGGPITITAGVNDELTISIDGGAATTVTLAAGQYSGIDELAKMIENSINTALGNSEVRVLAIGNKLQFTRLSTDTSASISIDGTSSAAADLGLDSVTYGKGSLVQVFENFIEALDNGDVAGINAVLGDLDRELDNVLRIRADIGARQNRLELTAYRLDSDLINFTRLMSENEDVDMAETIIRLKNEENVYRASLAGGARIIQTSLIDFLR